jgi:hypothetical protein
MNVKIIAVAILSGLFGAVGVWVLAPRDAAREPAPLPPDGASVEAAAELREAAQALRDLARSVRREEASRGVSPEGSSPPPAGPLEAGKPSPSPDVERLLAMMERVLAALSAGGGALVQAPLRDSAGSQSFTPRPMRTLYTSEEAATKSLLLLSRAQVLERLGLPEQVSGSDGTLVWSYPDGYVSFIDGLVCNAYVIAEPEPADAEEK